MTESTSAVDVVERLRGIYRVPVNDGCGPLNGSMEFVREFPTTPIMKEAADEIERLRTALATAEQERDEARAERDNNAVKIAELYDRLMKEPRKSPEAGKDSGES